MVLMNAAEDVFVLIDRIVLWGRSLHIPKFD
jgi:hypothetical protein